MGSRDADQDAGRFSDQRDGEVLVGLHEFEAKLRARQRFAALASILLLAGVAATVYLTVRQVAAKQHELNVLREKITSAQQEQQALEKVRRELEETNRALKNANQQIDKEIEQKRAYANTIRAILKEGKVVSTTESVLLSEVGNVPAGLKAGLKPHVSVRGRNGQDGNPVYDVELWVEMAEVSEALVESVAYDLDEHYYDRRHFVAKVPRAHVGPFVVKRCDSKVLTTIVLKDGQGSIVVDFDWCKTAEWHSAASQH